MLGKYENIDRRVREPDLEPVDVILPTLDAEIYLERCLDSLYREVPVNKVIVVDGGSKDKTVEILKQYPRMEIHIRPDFRTTGKCYEYQILQATTPWIVFIDADIELPAGWYDEMVKHEGKYDFFGCKRIMHYEFNRVDPTSLDINKRPMGAPWLARRDSFKNYHVDDDYMVRATDMLMRQVAEKDGYKFGKIAGTYHYHHTTDNLLYESDKEKRGSRLVFEEPKTEILDEQNWEKRLDDFRRAVVKYLDPEFIYPRGDTTLLSSLIALDPEWIKRTNIKWYEALVAANLADKPVEYQSKTSVARKLRNVAGHTAGLLVIIRDAFKNYVRQIRLSLR